jgi:hypothetical protein
MATELDSTDLQGIKIHKLPSDSDFTIERLAIAANVNTGKLYKVTIEQWVSLLSGLNVSYKGSASTTTDPGTPSNPQFYTTTTAGTYTNFLDSSSTAIVVGDNEYFVIISFDGTAWSKQVIDIDLSGYATTAEFSPVENIVNGVSTAFGAKDDLDTYTGTNTSASTRVNILTSCPFDGYITRIDANASQVGAAQFGLWRLVSGTTYECIKAVTLTLTLGDNTFTSDNSDFTKFSAKTGDYFGVTLLSGQALIYDKSATGGCITVSSHGTEVTEGTSYTSTSTGAEFAIQAYVEIEAIGDKVDTNTSSIETLTSSIDDALTESDLTTEASSNLAKDIYKIDGLLINNVGAKQFSSDWRTYRIPVVAGDGTTFGRFSIDSGGYSSYFDNTDDPAVAGSDGLVNFNGSYATSDLPVTLTAPANAAWLYITVKRPTNVDTDSALLTINKGATLLAYESPIDKVSEISGYRITGGGSSDVASFSDLSDVPAYLGNSGKALKINDTEDGLDLFNPAIQDEAVSFSALTAAGLSLDLPSGTTEPSGLSIGDAWVDTTDGTIKVKLS